MANRTGIELLPDVCRVVEIRSSSGWFGRARGRANGSRIAAVHEFPYSQENPGACISELRRVLGTRSREVRIAMWGLHSSHQLLYLPQAERDELEAMARREARTTSGAAPGTGTGPASDGIMIGEHVESGRREIGYMSVSPAEISSRLQPFTDAGIPVTGVTTPAVAHALLVQQRWGQFGGNGVTAVLSVNPRATAITVVRGGVVVFARELPWGHLTERVERGGAFDAAAFAAQLASELRRSLVYVKQQVKVDVGHVLVCGDLPDLRSLTGPLMHELNVEVETVDSLEGFDVAHLPEPADEFRSRIGAYRTAWVLAAGAAPPVDVMPREGRTVRMRIDRTSQMRLGWAVAAGVAIAAAGWGASELAVRASRTHLDALRRGVTTLEPEVQRQADARRLARIVTARAAALDAFASQGPRLARVLEVFARNASGDVALTSVSVTPSIGAWRVKVEGQAEGENPQAAQSRFNTFMNGLRASSLLGEPVGSPSIRIKTQEPPEPDLRVAEAEREWTEPRLVPVEPQRPVSRGPAYVEIARDGRIYRIPMNRQVPSSRREEERWNLRSGAQQDTTAVERDARPRGTPRTTWADVPVRVAPSVLDFVIEYEVRK